ncbi:MAG: hypothetical protein HY060_25780 [Proteobacteria bacterium]|nr:hypothetical protein [Pseudomonadota bacterium]
MAPAGPLEIAAAASDHPAQLRERARRARALATRYRGEAANVLTEIADDFDARAAHLEAGPS